MDAETEFEGRRGALETTTKRLLDDLRAAINDDPLVDAVNGRVKSVVQYGIKARKTLADGSPKYKDPRREIQDQIGLRVIVKFEDERARLTKLAKSTFNEVEEVVKQPDNPDKFGYEATHLVMLIPPDIKLETNPGVDFFELQICTLFQHAWAEANHDVGYKPSQTLHLEQQRLRAWAAASAWGADRAFNELRRNLSKAVPDSANEK